MSDVTAGYDPFLEEEEEDKTLPPEECVWKIERAQIGFSNRVVYATFILDGDVVGTIRLPNERYLQYIREKIVMNK